MLKLLEKSYKSEAAMVTIWIVHPLVTLLNTQYQEVITTYKLYFTDEETLEISNIISWQSNEAKICLGSGTRLPCSVTYHSILDKLIHVYMSQCPYP